ncbi:MAG: segregation/condensation protein A [Rubellimicrobium sp.]|nr:segregation/condensation protein A [Rubellimicrobium sp.]
MNDPGPDLPQPGPARDEAFIVDVDGFEGPLDLLLTLARGQKVDLRQISVLALAEQYLTFVEKARTLRIELAADYLVMAAWLAWLKSRLLLPPDPAGDGPSAEDMAGHLAWQLARLEAMREAGAWLMARPRLGQEVFARGQAHEAATARVIRHEASLLDLLRAYARLRTRDDFRPLVLDRENLMTMEQALERLRAVLGTVPGWRDLRDWLPEGWRAGGIRLRSAQASTLAASLQLVKEGLAEIRQDRAFGPLEIRARPKGEA